MAQIIKQPKWKVVEYSRSQIINAGSIMRKANITDDERSAAIKIIDNWRAAHAFPLHVIYIHLRRMVKNVDSAIVAERLKRLDSIINKLKREKNMNLWTMQDLGGCRVIVPTIKDVYNFSEIYEASRKRHILKKTYDYIKNPKNSGYRSLHVVYEYHSDKKDTYNKNIQIEIQFRTHLQHLWATAVETMGLFTKEAIKSGQGSDDIKRFFVLVSALFAIREKQPNVPNVINDVDEIVHELESLDAKNNYLNILSGIRVAVDFQEQKPQYKNDGYCIMILNYNTNNLRLKFFNSSQIEEANNTYNLIESNRTEEKIDAVLVRVSSFSELKKAYPNYFSDIAEFINIVKSYLN